MTISEEQKLIAAAAAGDKEAMEMLFEAYKGLLVKAAHFAKVRTVTEDAMGVAQVEFLQAVRRYDPGRGVNFAAFAKSMVYAGVHQFFRRELRHWQHEFMPGSEEEEASSSLEAVADPRDAVGEWETEEDMRQAFSCLTEREREAIELVYLKGMTQRVAAKLLSVTPQTLHDAKQRAVRKLRAYFACGKTGTTAL